MKLCIWEVYGNKALVKISEFTVFEGCYCVDPEEAPAILNLIITHTSSEVLTDYF